MKSINFYKFDKYSISKNIILKEKIIYDERIDKSIKLEEDEYNIIQNIFNNNTVKDLLNSKEVEQDIIRTYLEWLYNNDFITLKRDINKKTIYLNSIILMFSKAILIFFIRIIILIILFNLILNISLINLINNIIIFMLVIISHELGHLITYYILSGKQTNIYINIYLFKFEIITPIINNKTIKIVAAMGPIIGIFMSLFLFMFLNEKIALGWGFFNIMSLFPFMEDGKNIWHRNY